MIGDEAEDSRWYEAALAGEEAAFTALWRRWQGSIYRFALRLSNSASIAEDVTQEAFLALLDADSRFDPAKGSLSSYLYGIARNQVLRRMAKERLFRPMDEETAGSDMGMALDVPMMPDPLGDLTHQERLTSLYRAIDALPLRYREVVLLCELEELGYAETAQALGCPEGTVRSRLHRARALLLEKLGRQASEGHCVPRIEPVRCLP